MQTENATVRTMAKMKKILPMVVRPGKRWGVRPSRTPMALVERVQPNQAQVKLYSADGMVSCDERRWSAVGVLLDSLSPWY